MRWCGKGAHAPLHDRVVVVEQFKGNCLFGKLLLCPHRRTVTVKEEKPLAA